MNLVRFGLNLVRASGAGRAGGEAGLTRAPPPPYSCPYPCPYCIRPYCILPPGRGHVCVTHRLCVDRAAREAEVQYTPPPK